MPMADGEQLRHYKFISIFLFFLCFFLCFLCSFAFAEEKVFNLDAYDYYQYKGHKYTLEGLLEQFITEHKDRFLNELNRLWKIDELKEFWKKWREI
jgi:hypothetical protein